jgi:GntR family transcriptional regulator, carbon starvation induced regulator
MPVDAERELSLVDQGYLTLRGRIVRGEFSPEMRLRLDALQQTLGLSSSPLREALNRLVAEGLVEVEDGRGFRVAPVSLQRLKELTYLRVLIEGDALRRSVELGDDEWEGRVVSAFHKLSRLEKRLSDASQDDKIAEEWSARHREFHMALLSGCGFARQLAMCGMLFDQAERYRRLARQSRQPRKKNAEHNALEDAALSRNADKSVELLTAHIQKTADRLSTVLQKSGMDAIASV